MADEIDYKRLIEAALFMSSNPLSVNDLVSVTGIMSPGKVQAFAKELVEEYRSKNTSLQILEIDNRYLFAIKEPYASKVSGLAIGPDLSKGALRILAFISRNEGVLQSDLVKAFGSTTYEYMSELGEKRFVETKPFKRSKRVFTTPKFREYFSPGIPQGSQTPTQ
jgi:chromosome segregation and condensation protein ScpB